MSEIEDHELFKTLWEFRNAAVDNGYYSDGSHEQESASDREDELHAKLKADLASLLHVAEAAREMLKRENEPDIDFGGERWCDATELLAEALAALPAPGERKAGGECCFGVIHHGKCDCLRKASE